MTEHRDAAIQEQTVGGEAQHRRQVGAQLDWPLFKFASCKAIPIPGQAGKRNQAGLPSSGAMNPSSFRESPQAVCSRLSNAPGPVQTALQAARTGIELQADRDRRDPSRSGIDANIPTKLTTMICSIKLMNSPLPACRGHRQQATTANAS